MPKSIGRREFIALMAMLTALDALSIDSMLPALGLIGEALGADGNTVQLVIALFIAGMATGQLFAGPLADAFGRKPAIYGFFAIFLLGSLLTVIAPDFYVMLLGRFLQGLGAAGPYVITIAIVRDRFSGNEMAQVMSFVLSVFILVPILAPLIGQGILMIADWRWIFVGLLGFAAFVLLWFTLRQPETLAAEHRRSFSITSIYASVKVVCQTRQSMTYTVVYGLVFGAFLSYLKTSQQTFQDLYGLGELFPVVFASLSVCIGIAAVTNGRLVVRLGMRRLCASALTGLAIISIAFLAWSLLFSGVPPLWSLIIYLGLAVFCFGILFGNLSGLALEPLGDQAGTGATVFGSLSTMIAMIIGTTLGQFFDMTVLPLTIGFAVLSGVAVVLMMAREEGSVFR